MAKHAVSVTIDSANLIWLKARVGAAGARSVSDLLDRLITDARTRGSLAGVRSVVGTIDIAASDPLLNTADDAIAALFEHSLRRPAAVKEPRTRYGTGRRRKTRARG